MQKVDFKPWFSEFLSSHNISKSESKKVIFISLEEYHSKKKNSEEFIVFEDQWIKNPEIIKSKISSFYGKNKTIFARKCFIKKLNKKTSAEFLNKNHIYGSSVSKHQLGLFFNDELIAVATFAAQRKFESGKSAEMLRFCNKKFITVIGGLSKLIKTYIKFYEPDNIMTYADLDWGKGDSYKKLGFIPKNKKKGIKFYCNKKTGERIPEKYFTDFENISEYAILTNSGSIKYILSL
jgi:hypothetical protein